MTLYTLTVFSDVKVDTPVFGGGNDVKRNISIDYDKSKLMLTNATIHGYIDKPAVGLINANAWLYIDGVEEVHETWIAIGGKREFNVDVTEVVHTAKVYEFKVVVNDISANTFYITVYLDLTFTELVSGSEPTITSQPIVYGTPTYSGFGGLINTIANILPSAITLIMILLILRLFKGITSVFSSSKEKE